MNNQNIKLNNLNTQEIKEILTILTHLVGYLLYMDSGHPDNTDINKIEHLLGID